MCGQIETYTRDRSSIMDAKWDFDAPQFVDFTQPHIYEHEYDDTWFDRHTEDDDFKGEIEEEGDDSAKKLQMKKPQRVLKGTSHKLQDDENEDPTETDSVSCSDQKAMPGRVPVAEKHGPQNSTKSICPSPKKRQKLSNEGLVDPTSPAANTRQKTSSPRTEEETSNDNGPAANTRQNTPKQEIKQKSQEPTHAKSANKTLQAVKSFMTKLQGKSPKKTPNSNKTAKSSLSDLTKPLSATKAKRTPPVSKSLKSSHSFRSKMLPKAASTSSLQRQDNSDIEKPSPDTGLKGQLSETDIKSTTNLKVKSSEELELEKIAAMKKKLARTRKLAQESYKKAITPHNYLPMRSTQPATLPVGFHFKTDERLKTTDVQVQGHKVKDFAKSLREALPQTTLPTKPHIPGVTRCQPFKLTSTKSASNLQAAQKYETVAEKIVAFHRKTPERFRSCPGGKERSRSANKSDNSGHGHHLRSQSPKLTIPKTPTLTTRSRYRPVHVLSREEKEHLEYEEHHKQQFKAHPVNSKVFEEPSLPKVPTKPPTLPEGFHFHYNKSTSVGDLRRTGTEAEEKKYEFHAKPVNTKILAGPVGIKYVESQPVTVPESPAFALKNRVRIPVEVPKQTDMKNTIKVNPVPYAGIPFRPRLAHHCTVPEPFEVEERSREMLQRREQKIQHILEEEKKLHEFHAQTLPSCSPDTLPPKQVRPLTQPEPFHLEVEERGERYQEEFRAKIDNEVKAAQEAAQFKAQPVDVIHKEPFQPKKSTRALTEISEIILNTDLRAVQREEFDNHLKQREAELLAFKRQKEEYEKQEEEGAIAKLRQEAVHKATGIKKYKNVFVKPSDKPLTDAQSPRFSQRIRPKYSSDV